MEQIFHFLSSLSACRWHAHESLSEFTYNGVTYDEGTETYQTILEKEFLSFKCEVLKLLPDGISQIQALYKEFKELLERYYDIPDKDTLALLERDNISLNSASLAREIKEVKFLQAMYGIQQYYIDGAVKFLAGQLPECKPESIKPEEEEVGDNQDKVIFRSPSELCREFPSLKIHKVRDREWRKANCFPDHQDCRGGKCVYYRDEVMAWIKEHS